jgi:hypothetical protein
LWFLAFRGCGADIRSIEFTIPDGCIFIVAFRVRMSIVKWVVENNKILPLGWLELRDRWPWGAAPEDENMLVGSQASGEGTLRILFTMRGFHRIKRDIKLRLRKRGVFTLGPLEALSGDPLRGPKHIFRTIHFQFASIFCWWQQWDTPFNPNHPICAVLRVARDRNCRDG